MAARSWTASITGTVSNATFDAGANEFSVPNGSGLVISNVDNCSGLLNSGDMASYKATYQVVTSWYRTNRRSARRPCFSFRPARSVHPGGAGFCVRCHQVAETTSWK